MIDTFSFIVSLALLAFCCCALMSILVLKLQKPHYDCHKVNFIYGLSLFACGFFSFLYTTHFPALSDNLLRQFDHAAIFLLIAGTYTPFASRQILGLFRIPLLYWIWGIALTGVVLRLLLTSGYDQAFIVLYVAAGWSFVSALREILVKVPGKSLLFLGLGALVYTGGAVVFAVDAGSWTVPVWHIFVLFAAMLHFFAVLFMSRNSGSSLRPLPKTESA